MQFYTKKTWRTHVVMGLGPLGASRGSHATKTNPGLADRGAEPEKFSGSRVAITSARVERPSWLESLEHSTQSRDAGTLGAIGQKQHQGVVMGSTCHTTLTMTGRTRSCIAHAQCTRRTNLRWTRSVLRIHARARRTVGTPTGVV